MTTCIRAQSRVVQHANYTLSDKCVPPPPSPGTKWTRRVPHPVLIGHAASLAPYRG